MAPKSTATPLVIASLRMGMNNTDPPHSLPDPQCVLAQNIEWRNSTLGERRRGMTAIDLTSSTLNTIDTITFLGRHLPTNDETQAELWALGINASTSVLARKTTTWSTVSMSDALSLSGGGEVSARTLHGKYFIAYKSAVDRLHVWDGTSLRRVGIAAPANAPTAVNAGVGTFTGTRYYRVRWTVQSGGSTIRRSEPSPVRTFAPSGTGASVTVTQPTNDSESATHWELEASTDNANFYRVSTIAIGVTTYSDTATYVPGYTSFTLSEDIEDYALIPSGRYLSVDEDRLLIGGSWNNSALESRVAWTPVFGATGSGNDERLETDTDPFIDLDGFEGGPLTGLSNSINGAVYAFKRSHIYRLVRTGNRTSAYEAICLSKQRGAIPGSVVEGVDQVGRPCVYFLDPIVGPCRLGSSGLEQCGGDIRTTWDAIQPVDSAIGVYYSIARQVQWMTLGSSAQTWLVLHVDWQTDTPQGTRGGWAVWNTAKGEATAMCMYSDNIDDNGARSLTFQPLIAIGNGIYQSDNGDTDAGVAYSAIIRTKPYLPGAMIQNFGVMAGTLLATASANTSVDVTAIRDFGIETIPDISVDLSPVGSETHVIRVLDDLSFSELMAVQFEFNDPAINPSRWELHQLVLKPREEELI